MPSDLYLRRYDASLAQSLHSLLQKGEQIARCVWFAQKPHSPELVQRQRPPSGERQRDLSFPEIASSFSLKYDPHGQEEDQPERYSPLASLDVKHRIDGPSHTRQAKQSRRYQPARLPLRLAPHQSTTNLFHLSQEQFVRHPAQPRC